MTSTSMCQSYYVVLLVLVTNFWVTRPRWPTTTIRSSVHHFVRTSFIIMPSNILACFACCSLNSHPLLHCLFSQLDFKLFLSDSLMNCQANFTFTFIFTFYFLLLLFYFFTFYFLRFYFLLFTFLLFTFYFYLLLFTFTFTFTLQSLPAFFPCLTIQTFLTLLGPIHYRLSRLIPCFCKNAISDHPRTTRTRSMPCL